MLSPAFSHAKPPANESDRQRAVEHFKLGNEAFANGDSLQAYTEYTAAWSLHESFDIACNLGRTEAELGKSRDAAEHLAYCLSNFSASARPEIRSAEGKLREVFSEVKTRVSSLTLRVEPDGAVVRVDGGIVGKTPLRRDLYLDPGEHEVDVRMTGYQTVRRAVQAARGERQELLIELPSDSSTAAPQPGGASPATQAGGLQLDDPVSDASASTGGVPTRTIALLTTGGLSLVGLGIGGGYWFHSRRLDDEARQARRAGDAALGSGGCRINPDAIECVRLSQALDDRDRATTIATIGFATGGVFALGTVAAYFLWPPRPGETGTRATPKGLAWSPVVSQDEVGLVISGQL